jgi:hypothetical protein
VSKKKNGESGTPPGGYDDLIYKARSTRYVLNGLRGSVSGMADGLDGRTKLGQKLKPHLHEAHVALALAKDRMAVVLRELGDKPLEGDPGK